MTSTLARDRVFDGVPLVNHSQPALSVIEFMVAHKPDLMGVGIRDINQAILRGRLPGGVLDVEGRPVVVELFADEAVQWLRRRREARS